MARHRPIVEWSALKFRLSAFASTHLNFYRTHMLLFTFTPLVLSGIFYASNGDNKIAYIDCLFLCTSAFCVTGLNPVLIASLTRWQQVILFLAMGFGSLTSVSLVTILIRRHFFKQKFLTLVRQDPVARQKCEDIEASQLQNEGKIWHKLRHPRRLFQADSEEDDADATVQEKPRKKAFKKLSIGMIRKVDDQERMQEAIENLKPESPEVVPAELPSDGEPDANAHDITPDDRFAGKRIQLTDREEAIASDEEADVTSVSRPKLHHVRRASEGLPLRPPRHPDNAAFQRIKTLEPNHVAHFPRTTTVEFRDEEPTLRRRHFDRRSSTMHSNAFSRTQTRASQFSSSRNEGFGGFPNPLFAIPKLLKSKLDERREMKRTLTSQSKPMSGPSFARVGTIASASGFNPQPVNYITFDAVVGRNSHFKSLTAAQEEELGGVEYRALSLLTKIVTCYCVGIPLLGVLMTAPYLATSRFDHIFKGPGGTVPTWYTFFNVWSGLSNTGLSLLDASMVPFDRTYWWIILMGFMILAGNTAFPIFLRLIVWVMSKLVPAESRTKITLQFLLDHPRRSFLYLFPAYQTWFLVFVLLVLNCIDWFFYLLLDIGNKAVDVLPLRFRVIDGLFQAIAVRAAGFQILNISETVPALQVLYVVMMYIAVYPIALSVRSTNVYEERSMGIFNDDDDESDAEEEFNRKQATASYIAYHARKQLTFDLWWLILALFLICIAERDHIRDPASDSWFNVFTVMFEVTSAYATCGLSLGSPVMGTSLCGSFSTLSKLILVPVMIRGRHRGLPNAIDRAVLLPSDMTLIEQNAGGPQSEEARSLRRNSTIFRDDGLLPRSPTKASQKNPPLDDDTPLPGPSSEKTRTSSEGDTAAP